MDNLKAKYALEYAGKLAESTATIVSAWLAVKGPLNVSRMGEDELIELTEDVRAALAKEYNPDLRADAPPAQAPKKAPAVPIKKSVQPDHIVCLDDGLKFRSLKRHLSKLGMTPEEYREKWGLPSDYPMTAPDYSERRSVLAKKMGLGTRP